jgi:hypothetical protein
MTNQTTIDKLHAMRLGTMADAFESQLQNTDTFAGLSFEDRFGMLVDTEWAKRRSTKLQKLIRTADFRYPNACIEGIEYFPDRKLDKSLILRLSACRYIQEGHHIILEGASGNGKTYIACALGVAACRNFLKVRYIRLPELLNDLVIARGEGTFKKLIRTYQKVDLLIIDEWLLKTWTFLKLSRPEPEVAPPSSAHSLLPGGGMNVLELLRMVLYLKPLSIALSTTHLKSWWKESLLCGSVTVLDLNQLIDII